MEIVGIDFGTTNVRISVWDPDDPEYGLPRPLGIGRGIVSEDNAGVVDTEAIGDVPYMPVVLALQRQSDDSVSTLVGEDADRLEDGPNTVVIRNIKRWAQASDSRETHVMERMAAMGIPHPENWEWKKPENGNPGYVEVWGQKFDFKDLMAEILREAIRRADLPDEFEWRAGCPVHAGIEYRTWLNELLTEISGRGNLNWIADEPVLFLTLLRRIGNLKVGSHLVYDLGGGSFDCALVKVLDDGEMIVYGADGHPLLGGSDIDQALKQQFPFVPENLLRLAKESASPANSVVGVTAGVNLSWDDIEANLKKQKFIPRSLMALRDSYTNAKVVWGREEKITLGGKELEHFPFGELLAVDDGSDNPDPNDLGTGLTRFVWQLSFADIPQDVDGIILFGGPTQSPFFAEQLRRHFGNDKIHSTVDLVAVPYATLVALSMGACYFSEGQYSYTVPTRLPVRVTLENLQTGENIEYTPHERFGTGENFFDPYISSPLRQEPDNPSEYQITVTDPDGVVLRDDEDRDLRLTFNGFMEPRKLLQEEGCRQPATSLKLIIDRLGYIWVEMKSEGVGLTWTKEFRFPDSERGPDDLPPSLPWQSEAQREAWKRIQEKITQLEEKRRLKFRSTLNRPAHWKPQ